MERGTVLVVDDEAAIGNLLRLYLEREGYRVNVCLRGDEAVQMVVEEPPDLVLLDLLLPGISGEEVCRRIRADSDVPIIMVTARTDEQDKLRGLAGGADDYITKPFSPLEVVARVGAVLRRVRGDRPRTAESVLSAGRLRLDLRNHQAFVDDQMTPLTPTEFRLLETLAREPGRAFTRDQLCDLVLGPDFDGFDRTIDVHVMNLRRKLGLHPSPVRTVYGIGYRLAVEP